MFPEHKLTTKHHFLSHYPYLIKCFGPLRHLWTLRFESKHRYFKSIIRHSPNYKNVLYSLSNKHQLLQILNTSSEVLFSDTIKCDGAEEFNKDNCFDLILKKSPESFL